MADTTLPECETALVQGFLTYADWAATGETPPYAISFGVKWEANPRRVTTVSAFPALTVHRRALRVGTRMGQQWTLDFVIRCSIIHKYTLDEEPTTQLRTLTGQMIENILQTRSDLASKSFVNLSWVQDIPAFEILPDDNELDGYLRMLAADQAGSGYGYIASQVDFAVQATRI